MSNTRVTDKILEKPYFSRVGIIKQKVPVIGTTIEVPLEQAILTLVPDGKVNVGNLMSVINKLPDLGVMQVLFRCTESC